MNTLKETNEYRDRYLKTLWNKIMSKCCRKENATYEGIYIQENWKTFENFFNDNKRRYRLAVNKNKKYKRFDLRNGDISFKCSIVSFALKNKEKGYTFKNTVFCNPSERMKYRRNIHKYMFENKLLGTRNIKDILKKRGILLTMETITLRLRNGKSLFEPNKLSKYLYKGKYVTGMDIALKENVQYGNFNANIRNFNYSVADTLKYLKSL